jgi:hypothetical protein
LIAVEKLSPRNQPSRNINMPGLRDKATLGWPFERLKDDSLKNDWLHSDFRNIALPYVYPVYESMLDITQLRETRP